MPFPAITECTNETTNGENCSLTASLEITITCTVSEYFPRISLYFRHGSRNITSLKSSVWNNPDGTLNKTATITAIPSDDPYICVASDIPGYEEGEQTAAIFIDVPLPESTNEDLARITTQHTDTRGAPQASQIVRE